MKKRILLIVLVCLAVIAASIVGCWFMFQPKFVYVDINKLYNEFTYKKEIEIKFNKEEGNRQRILDSLKLDLQNLSDKINNLEKPKKSKNEKLVTEFMEKKYDLQLNEQQFMDIAQKSEESYKEQIWKQLNQYVLEYGKKKNYKYIFGAQGNGALMYASEAYNITDDVIDYVNLKYDGYQE